MQIFLSFILHKNILSKNIMNLMFLRKKIFCGQIYFLLFSGKKNIDVRSPHLQTQHQDGCRLTNSYISFSSSPVHSTEFSFHIFPGFLATFIVLPSKNNNS